MKPVQLTVFIIWAALCCGLLVYAGMLSSMTFMPGKAADSSLGSIIALAAGSIARRAFPLD